MNTRHKWADVAIAFAEGKTIQFKDLTKWVDWMPTDFPTFKNELWRIKPDEPVVRYKWAHKVSTSWYETNCFYTEEEVKIAELDNFIRLDHTRTEFPE